MFPFDMIYIYINILPIYYFVYYVILNVPLLSFHPKTSLPLCPVWGGTEFCCMLKNRKIFNGRVVARIDINLHQFLQSWVNRADRFAVDTKFLPTAATNLIEIVSIHFVNRPMYANFVDFYPRFRGFTGSKQSKNMIFEFIYKHDLEYVTRPPGF